MEQGEINKMEFIKCFKFDLRIMREKKQYTYIILFPIFIYIMMNYMEVGLTCLLFLVMIYIGLPFSNENADKLENIYYLLPCKLSSMVLGRFLYLSIILLITILLCSGTGIYYITKNSLGILEIVKLIVVVNFSIIIDYISYPLCYLAQLEKNNHIKTAAIIIISLVLILAVLFIPVEMIWMTSVYTSELNYIGIFIIKNKEIYTIINVLSIAVIEYISYLASCRICKRKEV